jgi:hypothetical protein
MARWEGKPAKYQVDRVEVLRKELAEVGKELDDVVAKDVKALDAALKQHQLEPIPTVGVVAPPDELDELALHCVASAGADCHGDQDAAAETDR